MKKLSYYNGNDNYGQEYYPFNQFIPSGMVQEYDRDLDRYENKQRDGKNFEEFNKFKKKRRLKLLKRLLKLKNKKKDVLEQHPFYESLYGTPADMTGLNTSPLEYYSGTIADSPDAATNPYANSYQTAHSRNERIKIRAMTFADIKKA